MKVYLAGPLFSQAERDWLSSLAARLRADAIECLCRMKVSRVLNPVMPVRCFPKTWRERVPVIFCWHGWMGPWWMMEPLLKSASSASGCGAAKNLRSLAAAVICAKNRRRSFAAHAGLNLFVAGAIQSAGVLVWSIDDAIASLNKFA